MSCLERRWNLKIAIIVPSVLFAIIHILTYQLDFISIIQLLIAGSVVGILFSLVTYESNTIWNSALMHSIWDMAIVGGVLHLGIQADPNFIYNFVLNNKSAIISGGDFGIEASIIAVFVYILFSIVAFYMIKKSGRTV